MFHTQPSVQPVSTWKTRFGSLLLFLIGTGVAPGQTVPLFRTTPAYPVGHGPAAIASCDLNEDGLSDVVTADESFDDVAVLLNDGMGGFWPQFRFGVGRGATDLACTDLNGDGHADVVTADTADGTLTILSGNGNGTFQIFSVRIVVQSAPLSLAVADMDGNSFPDIAVGSAAQIRILLNMGGLTFSAAPPITAAGTAVGFAQLDGDGHADLMAADSGGNLVRVFWGLGDGSFTASTTPLSVGSSPSSVAAGDLKEDGVLDLVVTNSLSNNVTLFTGLGGRQFSPPAPIRAGVGPMQVHLVDVNGDGHFDLLTANEGGNEVAVYLGRGDGTFQSRLGYGTGDSPRALTISDFDGDGLPDVAGVNFQSNDVSLLLGLGNGTFRGEPRLAVGTNPRAVAVCDLNNDGIPDLASANFNSNDVSVMIGQGEGRYAPEVRYPSAEGPIAIACADIKEDGRLDLVIANNVSSEVSLLWGVGNGTFSAKPRFSAGTNPLDLAVCDVDEDGHVDVITANGAGAVSILHGFGNGFFAPETLLSTTGVGAVTCGDMNLDGHQDLVFLQGPVVCLQLGNGDGSFGAVSPNFACTPGSKTDLVVAQLDGDAIPDLAVTVATSSIVETLMGVGDGTFTCVGTVGAGVGPESIFSADLDLNNTKDLMLCNAMDNDISVFPGVGDGRFSMEGRFGVGENPRMIIAEDIDNDGDQDLIVVNSISDSLSLLFNATIQFPISPTDFDGDGIPDGVDNCPQRINAAQLDFDSDGTGNRCDTDIDNDGIVNGIDLCDFTPFGSPVRADGNVPADMDVDCDVDRDDFSSFSSCLTGPCVSPPCNPTLLLPLGCLSADFDGNGAIDLRDMAGLQASFGLACVADSQCTDGSLCTNDICLAGVCQHAPVTCSDDGLFCNGVDTCDPLTGLCNPSGTPCAPGEFCCESTDSCAAECCFDAVCDDGNSCTDDTCAAGVCQHGPVTCADDGLFCNGPEVCDPVTGLCLSNGIPCAPTELCCESVGVCVAQCCSAVDCDDFDLCTTDSCTAGLCQHAPVTCGQDGVFCNGAETCDSTTGQCAPSGNPCLAGEVCLEAARRCATACTSNADCGDDGLFCNGVESCDGVSCFSSGNPCPPTTTCDEGLDTCLSGSLISGVVTNYLAVPVGGIPIVFTGEGAFIGQDFTVTTDAAGGYVQLVPPNWSGMIASDSNHRLEPPLRVFSNVSNTVPSADFTVLRNYYVDKPGDGIGLDGSDVNPGTLSAPFATIEMAVDQVKPGDTVFIRAGTYTEWVRITRSGTASHRITLTNYQNEVVTLDGEGIRTGCVTVGFPDNYTSGHYVTVDGLRVTGTKNGTNGGGGAGALMYHAQHSIFRNITAFHCGFGGTTLTAPLAAGIALRGACSDCTVQFCEVYDNDQGGISISRAGGVAPGSPRNITIDNCYVHNNENGNDEDSDGIWINAGVTGSSNIIVTNCIVHDNADDGIDAPSSNGVVMAYNIAFEQGRNTLTGDGNGLKVSTSVGGAPNGGGNHTLHHNIVFSNARSGIDQDISSDAPHNFFYNNTIYGNGGHGLVLDVGGGSNLDTAAVVLNNIMYNNGMNVGSFLDYRAGLGGCGGIQPNVILDSNFNFVGDGCLHPDEGVGTLTGNPLLANPGAVIDTTSQGSLQATMDFIRAQVQANFSLQPPSPAIDAGIDLNMGFTAFDDPATINTGSVGNGTLDYFDMGAVEFGLVP